MEKEEKAAIAAEVKVALGALANPLIRGVVLIVLDADGRLLIESTTKTKHIAAALAREASYTLHQRASHPIPADAKIANLDEMLEQIPKGDEREEMRAMITRMLKEGPEAGGARAVQTLSPGEPLTCPGCNEPLRDVGTPTFRHESQGAADHYECTGCYGSFEREKSTVDA